MNAKNTSIINIIAKNSYGETLYVESISKNLSKYTNINDIGKYIEEKLKWPKCTICRYDKVTQQLLLVYDAVAKKGEIDWNLDTSSIHIDQAVERMDDGIVTIIVICFEGCVGLGCAPESIVTMIEFLRLLAYPILAVYNYIFPFHIMSKKYKISKDFIKDTITIRKNWNVGFISVEDFCYKKIIERSIMKKLGYRKIGQKWNTEINLREKMPEVIIRGDYK